MEVIYRNVGSALLGSDGTEIDAIDGWAEIKGGIPLLADEKGRSCYSITEHGEGILAVWTSSYSFTDEKLGKHNTIPSDAQKLLYELEFWILESIRTKEFSPFMRGSFIASTEEEVIEEGLNHEFLEFNQGRKR
jgi:hypothetical protein